MNNLFLHSQKFLSSLFVKPPKKVRSLFFATAILDLAVASISIFEPIYLRNIGYDIPQILLFFIGVYGLYFAIQPLGGKITRIFGYEHGIMFSTPFLIGYYLGLFLIPVSPWFAVFSVVCFSMFKTLYWPGFHADFARFGCEKEQGRELGVLVLFLGIASVLGPVFGGVILSVFSFKMLFAVVSFLILCSNIPLLLSPEECTPRPLLYKDAYKRLFKKENRGFVFSYIGYGEELYALVLWPLVLFGVLGAYDRLGLLITVGTLITAIIAMLIGKLTDSIPRPSLLKAGALLTFITWPLRIFFQAPFALFGIETAYRVGRMGQSMPMIAMTYDFARSYSVTKSALLMEMSVIVGKISAALLALVAFVFFKEYAWQIVFSFGAAYSLLYLLFRLSYAKTAAH